MTRSIRFRAIGTGCRLVQGHCTRHFGGTGLTTSCPSCKQKEVILLNWTMYWNCSHILAAVCFIVCKCLSPRPGSTILSWRATSVPGANIMQGWSSPGMGQPHSLLVMDVLSVQRSIGTDCVPLAIH